MLYIIIPDGMQFAVLPKIKTKDGIDIETTDDCFVSDNENQAPISIQDTVKLFYTKHKFFDSINGLECHKHRPMRTSKPILAYTANRNGTLPGKGVVLFQKQEQSITQNRSSLWWATNAALPEDTKNNLEKKRTKQREDRRHSGDSPKAT